MATGGGSRKVTIFVDFNSSLVKAEHFAFALRIKQVADLSFYRARSLKLHHRQPRRVVCGVHLKIEKGENICNSTE